MTPPRTAVFALRRPLRCNNLEQRSTHLRLVGRVGVAAKSSFAELPQSRFLLVDDVASCVPVKTAVPCRRQLAVWGSFANSKECWNCVSFNRWCTLVRGACVQALRGSAKIGKSSSGNRPIFKQRSQGTKTATPGTIKKIDTVSVLFDASIGESSQSLKNRNSEGVNITVSPSICH
jgi:hypothetical protein